MKKNNKGFSLIELIVVISIMAILAAIAVVSYSIYIDKAHEASDQQYLDNLEYIAQLVATEHQIELSDPGVKVLKDIVDEPEDIVLVVIDPDTKDEAFYTCDDSDFYREIIEEIYNSVGNWEFTILKQECDHKNCEITKNTATCLDPGKFTYSCGDVEDSPALGHDLEYTEAGGVMHEKCKREGCGHTLAGGIKPPDADE